MRCFCVVIIIPSTATVSVASGLSVTGSNISQMTTVQRPNWYDDVFQPVFVALVSVEHIKLQQLIQLAG